MILADLFVDLTEVPPAKGRSPGINKLLEGQLILIQPMDLLQTKHLIRDFPTWLQCFSVYVAVLLTKFPQRATSLLLYQKNLAYLSLRFEWPAWVVYDNTYRQEAADVGKVDWSQVDYGIYARCFHNQKLSVEAWCSGCHSVDHLQDNCPFGRKRPSASHPGPSRPKRSTPPICRSFNKGDGRCKFEPRCHYAHVCLQCQGSHPVSQCRQGGRYE